MNLFIKGLSFISLLVVISLALGTSKVSANGMPYWQNPGTVTGNIMPIKEDKIRIIGEELLLEAHKGKELLLGDNPIMEIRVKATYRMVNDAAKDLEIPVAFPQEGYSYDWKVKFNDQEITLTEKDSYLDSAMVMENTYKDWVDPWTGQTYELATLRRSTEYFRPTEYRVQTFNVLFPAHKEHKLEVSYVVRAGQDELHALNPIYRFDYFLDPASYWNGFQDLSVTLNIPYAHKLHSSLPLEKISRNKWQGHFRELPQENLHIFFTPTFGAWGGLVTTRRGATTFLALTIALFWLVRRWVQNRNFPAPNRFFINLGMSLIVTWVGYVTFSKKLLGYPLNILLQYVFYGSLLLWLTVIMVSEYRRSSDRK